MLTIEDGTIVAGADSFAALADFRTYATNYGLTVPDDDAACEALLRRAAVQMGMIKWKGERTDPSQALCWPRQDVWVDGSLVDGDTIPRGIEYGQMALAGEIYQDDLNPPDQRKGPVTEERVEGAVTVTYAATNDQRLMPAAPDRPSRAQFADYTLRRGLFAIRA